MIGVINLITTAIDKLFPDKTEAEKIKLRLLELQQNGELAEMAVLMDHDKAQAAVNQAEAGHASVFVAGWRPFIGWVCGFGLATYYIPKHFLAAVFWTRQCWEAQAIIPYPIDAAGLTELVFALLGLGGIRTWEKIKRVTK